MHGPPSRCDTIGQGWIIARLRTGGFTLDTTSCCGLSVGAALMQTEPLELIRLQNQLMTQMGKMAETSTLLPPDAIHFHWPQLNSAAKFIHQTHPFFRNLSLDDLANKDLRNQQTA